MSLQWKENGVAKHSKGFLNGQFPASFSLFFLFFSIGDSKYVLYDILMTTGFEPWTSGIGSNRSDNWASTTA